MRIEVQGTAIETEVAGDGPTVLFVHGWPDTHALWREVVPRVAGAGYRAIAVDLRGAGASARPESVGDYAIPFVVGDLVGVLDHLGIERAHVVGHDWGAAISWATAAFAPERVDHLVALSVGHPASFASAGLAQREKSWYMLAFQFEGVAERWLSTGDFANLRAWTEHPDIDEVTARLADPAALTAGLNLYRANLTPEVLLGDAPPVVPPVEGPALGIWSSDDFALTEKQMIGSAEFVKGPWRYERLEDVGHWIPLEVPDRLAELLLDFLPS